MYLGVFAQNTPRSRVSACFHLPSTASTALHVLSKCQTRGYLWREPVRMDNARLVAALGQEPHTRLDEAVEATLVGLGCLAASASSEAPSARLGVAQWDRA
jgi:hypothetical protein